MGETIWSQDDLKIKGDTRWAKVIKLVKDHLSCNQFNLRLALAERHQGTTAAQDFVQDFEQLAWDAELQDPDAKVLLLVTLNTDIQNRLDAYISI